MVLIAGLIGIGLAIEAAERRHTNRNAPPKNNSQEQQDFPSDSRVASERTKAQADEQAFREVQSYADFQKTLSERVSDDLMKEETPTSIYALPRSSTFKQRQSFLPPPHLDPSLFAPASPKGLAFPVVIPQKRSGDGRMVWALAYASALLQCGINQEAFCHFIDDYNEIMKSSSRCEVVNLLAMGVGYYSNMSQLLSSQAIPMAIALSKRSQSLEPTSTYLRQVNDQLFTPCGLYAMVATFSHSDSQIYTVDNPESYTNHSTNSPESIFTPASPVIFAEDVLSQPSPRRTRGSKNETKVVRRPASRKKTGQKSDNAFKNAFQGAFPTRARESKNVSNAIRGMMNGLGEQLSSAQPYESGNMAKDTLYLLIVNDTFDTANYMSLAPGIQSPFYNQNDRKRPSLQVDTSNRPWVYSSNNKSYEASNLGPPEHAIIQYTPNSPPAYDYVTKGNYDRGHTNQGDYCVPTL